MSGLWLTHEPKFEAVHTDRNTRGASFVVSSTSHQTGALVMYDEQRKRKLQHVLAAGDILYGQWSQGAHLNAKMPLKTRRGPLKLRRRTWTLYLDYRVFAANYVVRNNAGFEQ